MSAAEPNQKQKQKLVIRLKDPKRFLPLWLRDREEWLQTYAATEDDLFKNLSIRREVVTINKPSNRQTLAPKYNRQAIDIILHHSKTGHVKDFVINDSDLRAHVKEELTIKRIGGTPKEYFKIIDEIITTAVRRLFEDIDLVYYHEHLAGKLTVRILP
jgi:hypothetical protein